MTEPLEIKHLDDCPLQGEIGLCDCPMPEFEWEEATPENLSEVFNIKPVAIQ